MTSNTARITLEILGKYGIGDETKPPLVRERAAHELVRSLKRAGESLSTIGNIDQLDADSDFADHDYITRWENR